MNQPLHESPQVPGAREQHSILLAVNITGTVFALLAGCYSFAGLFEATRAAHVAEQYLEQMVIGGKSWISDLARIAQYSHWTVFIGGVSVSLLAIAYLWLAARRIPSALYASCVASVVPTVAGLVLHTGTRDVYDAFLLQTRTRLEARHLL